MKRIIISGAGGFIGCELTKKFIENGYEVIAISMFYNDSFPNSDLITKIQMDISDFDRIMEIIPDGEYEAFYHLAWKGVNGPEKANHRIQIENIKMMLACVDLANKIGCKKFLCAGTIAEQSVNSLERLERIGGGMMYGVAKHCAHLMLETYCKNIGQDFIWMQFSNIYGPKNKTGNLISYTIGQLINDEEATFGPAMQPYDFVFVDDLIEAVFRLGIKKTNCNFYYIGSGRPEILKTYLLKIGDILQKEELIKIGERPDDGIEYSFDMFDCSNLKRDIGDYITTDFIEGIIKTTEGYR